MPSRNDPCPCGSGRKFKQCCLKKSGGAQKPTAATPRRTASGPAWRQELQAAQAAQAAGRLNEAVVAFQRVLVSRPNQLEARFGLGQVLGMLGEYDGALEHIQAAVTIEPRSVPCRLLMASIAHMAGKTDLALEQSQAAIRLDPDNATALATLAACHERKNELDEGLAVVERALRVTPRDAGSRIMRATFLRRKGDAAAAATELEDLLKTPALPRVNRQHAVHELGFAYEKMKRYDDAFDCFGESGRLLEQDPVARRLSREFWLDRIRQYREGLTPELLGRFTAADLDDGLPAPGFLCGFSRSGTTLTEQVLATHPGVETSGEKPLIRNVRRHLRDVMFKGEPDDVPAFMERLTREQVLELRRLFWSEARRYTGKSLEGVTFVHKQPLNIIDIGLISFIFPEGRGLVALRDPRDVCLSCFQQNFELNAANIQFLSLESTVTFYTAAMEFWLWLRPCLPMATIHVRYEDTVTDLATQARRVLEHLGVPWDPAVLDFHENRSYVSSASYAAVVEPINRKAVGRWGNYRTHFEPHLAALAPYADAYGYGREPGDEIRPELGFE